MTDQPIPFSQVMANRIDERERQDLRAKLKGSKLLKAVLTADPAALPAEVRAARVDLEAEYLSGRAAAKVETIEKMLSVLRLDVKRRWAG